MADGCRSEGRRRVPWRWFGADREKVLRVDARSSLAGAGLDHRRSVEPAPPAWREVFRQRERAVAAAMQRFHPVAGRRDHPFDLVVLAFGQGQAQRLLAGPFAFGRPHGLWLMYMPPLYETDVAVFAAV